MISSSYFSSHFNCQFIPRGTLGSRVNEILIKYFNVIQAPKTGPDLSRILLSYSLGSNLGKSAKGNFWSLPCAVEPTKYLTKELGLWNKLQCPPFLAIYEAKWGCFKWEYSNLKGLQGFWSSGSKQIWIRSFKWGTVGSCSICCKKIADHQTLRILGH